MRLASQASCTEPSVRKRHTTLPLHVHWTLGLRALCLWLIFLLLLCARLFGVAVDLALLSLLRSRLQPFDGRLPGTNIVVILALLFPQRSVFGFLGFLLLPLLVCFLVQTVADVCCGRSAEYRPPAVLALYCVDLVVKGPAGLESSECLLVERIHYWGASRGRFAVGVCYVSAIGLYACS